MKKIELKKIITSKRFILISSFVILVMLSLLLNIAFSAFTSRNEKTVANIKVAGMNYNMTINGIDGKIITALKTEVTIANIIVKSLNEIDSKYELIYKVCSDSSCTNYINNPENLIIEYSSRTTDDIFGSIASNESKIMRIAINNPTQTTYYIEFGINAGYIHNTLVLQNLITSEYNEEDIKIAAIIDNEISTTFPTTSYYEATVSCTTNGGPSNAIGVATWSGTKWELNITGADSGQTVCNVNFKSPILRDKILAQEGGATAIETKGNPNFAQISTTSDTGLYASEDEYGMSYYYRGEKNSLNNNLIFGGFQWKIVRINGDGSIRVIYNGSEAQFNTNGTVNTVGINTQISGTHTWNATYINDNKYLGYMYGGANGVASTQRNGSISTSATYNETYTNAKTQLDNWYQTNIAGKELESKIVDNLFCNDRQLQSEVGGPTTGSGYGSSETDYSGKYRLQDSKNPTLKCGQKNDRFTKNDVTVGNGALTYPIGLITADEAAMAGLVYNTNHLTNYLYTNQLYWTFSPAFLSESFAIMWGINTTGSLSHTLVIASGGLRAVINLSSETVVTGEGSATNPYRVI